jgi:cobalt/nickel transport system permease protein
VITAVLAGAVLFSLFAGKGPLEAVLLLSVAAVLCFVPLRKHSHHQVLTMDVLSRRSPLAKENAAMKAGACGLLLLLCICSSTPWIPLSVFLYFSVVIVAAGKIKPHEYYSLLGIPAAFLLLSALTLLWDHYTLLPEKISLAVPFFGGYLAVTPESQVFAALVLSRALGGIGCLYFLSLSTPLPEILQVLKKIHVPGIMLELALLIYRYIFLLLLTFRQMQDAAASRLGYRGLKRSIRTTGMVYGNLLSHSFRKAGACFDAMESRCYQGDISFFTEKKKITGKLLLLVSIPAVVGILGYFLPI